MQSLALVLVMLAPCQTEAGPRQAQSLTRTVEIDGAKRTYHLYIPAACDPAKPAPVVVALHGAAMNGKLMEMFCGLNPKADKEGFLVVYPNGTGAGDILLTWNAGRFPGLLNKNRADDVAYLAKVLDELPDAHKIDPKRIYVTGMSNGGMMSYRVGAELSHRVAAIAPVAGTIMTDAWQPKHSLPVLHIHGTSDALVPYTGSKSATPAFVRFLSVADNMKLCVKANGCKEDPEESELPQPKDKVKIIRKDYGKGKNGAEVLLYVLEGGGHVWPGRPIPPGLLGPTTYNLIANDVIWDFFKKHQRQ